MNIIFQLGNDHGKLHAQLGAFQDPKCTEDQDWHLQSNQVQKAALTIFIV